MSRKIIPIIIIVLISAIFLCAAPAAFADDTKIPLPYSYDRQYSDITVHLTDVEFSDHAMGNVYTSTPLDRVKWVRLWYTYENKGNQSQKGYNTIQFVDNLGNTFAPPDGTYTGESVSPHTTSSPKFIEVPISKDANITIIRVIQGADLQDFPIPQPEAAMPIATAAPAASAQTTVSATAQASAKNTAGSGSCLPFLPFMIIGGIGGIGIVINRYGLKR